MTYFFDDYSEIWRSSFVLQFRLRFLAEFYKIRKIKWTKDFKYPSMLISEFMVEIEKNWSFLRV
jgi:hypothetical protein